MHVSRGQENGTFIARTPNKGSTIIKVTKNKCYSEFTGYCVTKFWIFNL